MNKLLNINESSSPHIEIYKVLNKSLLNSKLRKRPLSKQQTCLVIDKLCHRHGKDVVYSTIEWYCDKVQTSVKYLPVIKNHKTLHTKFSRVMAAKGRSDGPPSSENPNLHAILEDDAEEILSYLGMPIWPTNKDQDESLMFACSTLHACKEISRKFRVLWENSPYRELSDEEICLEYLHDMYAYTSDQTAMNWIRQVHSLACNWGGWKSNLMDYVPTLKNPHFTKKYIDKVEELTGSRKQVWFNILAELRKSEAEIIKGKIPQDQKQIKDSEWY